MEDDLREGKTAILGGQPKLSPVRYLTMLLVVRQLKFCNGSSADVWHLPNESG
jgi:hypothetical protein